MNEGNNSSGGFIVGLIIGAVFMLIFFNPWYQGKSAKEWKAAYEPTNHPELAKFL